MMSPLVLLLLLALVAVRGTLIPFENDTWESGYVDVAPGGDKHFYMLIKNRINNQSAPLLIWLNGGPGCSSTCGLMQENGPVYVDRTEMRFRYNRFSWNNFADMLYVDQPVGVGFSLARSNATFCRDETCVGNNFYAFFRNFLELHPEYRARPLFITGESYAGHYIPAIAAHMSRSNNPDINLKGVAIGNPLTRMPLQLLGYPQFLKENDVFNMMEYLLTRTITLVCYVAEQAGFSSKYLLDVCDMSLAGFQHLTNVYDIRDKKGYDDIDRVVMKLMNDTAVQMELGLKSHINYQVCNGTIGEVMELDVPTSRSADLEYLLATNSVEVMLYFGDKDFICNWRGGEQLADSLKWEGKDEFAKVSHKAWYNDDGSAAGTYRKYGRFNFLKVYDAGHMVPLDQPKCALSMITKFVYGQF